MMRRKGFWEGIGLTGKIIIFVVAVILVIGFLYLWIKSSASTYDTLHTKIIASLCDSATWAVRWALGC